MCGIAGIFKVNGNSVSENEIKSLTRALAHRGPDGEGFFVSENVGLGHRRLSILDLSSKGSQPMQSNDKDWIVVFNGCIYNYQTLKQELQSKGYTFRSTTDTEVITEGLSAYGPSFFERLDGMFAVGAYHKSSKTLWLSRDRYGVKPLYYWFKNGVLLFASEIKSFMSYPGFRVDVNFSALNEYFTFQNMFTFQTLFEGVWMLPPANTVKFDSSSTSVKYHSWWDYDFSKTNNQMDFEEARIETERLFRNAVSKQMIADVPIGSYLSGGMDSGSITALASKHVSRLATFTCGFDMSEVTGVEANYDERRDAELMANYLKTEHYEQVLNAGDIRWSLPRVVYHIEDLRLGMSYPNYYISRLASKFVKVCLQGTGGDELFGGYPWRYYRIFKSVSQNEFFDLYYDFWQRLVPDQQREQLYTDHTKKKINFEEPRKTFERVFTFNNRLSYESPEDHINNSLYFEAKTFLHGLLIVGDKLSMAHGLEERFPFLDNEMVNFAQTIPVQYKLGNLSKMLKIDENDFRHKRKVYQEFDDGKNILRKAMMSFLPERIINRKKQGFSAPAESWYRGENAAYICELLLHSKTVSSEFINQDYMKKIVHEHIDQRLNHRLLIWSFMNFEWWCRIFLNGEKYSL